MAGNDDPIKELLRYLTNERYEGGKYVSPLGDAVKAKLLEMVNEIADEVIGAHPTLRACIKDLVAQTVTKAVEQDKWLQRNVVTAVARSISTNENIFNEVTDNED